MLGGLRGRMDVGSSHDKETNQNNGKKYGPRFLKIKNRCPVTDLPFMFMYKVSSSRSACCKSIHRPESTCRHGVRRSRRLKILMFTGQCRTPSRPSPRDDAARRPPRGVFVPWRCGNRL